MWIHRSSQARVLWHFVHFWEAKWSQTAIQIASKAKVMAKIAKHPKTLYFLMFFMIFVVSGIPKIDQNPTTFPSKNWPRTRHPFGTTFFSILTDFDPHIDPKRLPKSLQIRHGNRTKIKTVWSASGDPFRTEKEKRKGGFGRPGRSGVNWGGVYLPLKGGTSPGT